MGAVIDPMTRCGDPLTCGYHRCMAHCCNKIAVAARFDSQHTKTCILTVEGNALDQSNNNLSGIICVLRRSGYHGSSLVLQKVPKPNKLGLTDLRLFI
jgi:expansin (peptidoglycan-binding protein)